MCAFGIDITPEAVCVYDGPSSKEDALDRLVKAVSLSGLITDRHTFQRAVHEREAIMSTGIGCGVAIPHVRVDVVRKATLGVGISREGIDFDTLDNELVHVIVLFAMPSGSQRQYLGLLADVMVALKDAAFRDRLMACDTPEEATEVLNAPTNGTPHA